MSIIDLRKPFRLLDETSYTLPSRINRYHLENNFPKQEDEVCLVIIIKFSLVNSSFNKRENGRNKSFISHSTV